MNVVTPKTSSTFYKMWRAQSTKTFTNPNKIRPILLHILRNVEDFPRQILLGLDPTSSGAVEASKRSIEASKRPRSSIGKGACQAGAKQQKNFSIFQNAPQGGIFKKMCPDIFLSGDMSGKMCPEKQCKMRKKCRGQ